MRSATQPLGSPRLLECARIASRLGEINSGLGRLADGACLLKSELTKGAARLRGVLLLEQITGLSILSPSAAGNDSASRAAAAHVRSQPASSAIARPAANRPAAAQPQEALLRKLTEAGDAVSLIAGGAIAPAKS